MDEAVRRMAYPVSGDGDAAHIWATYVRPVGSADIVHL